MEFRKMVRLIRLVAVFCAVASCVACAQAHRPVAEEKDAEAARIEAALGEIESRALADPELRRMNEALGEELMAAMVRGDPGLAAAVGRLPLLDDARARAIQAGDAATATEAAREIAIIERRYLAAQAAALRDASLAERVDRFNALLRRRMAETDESAGALLRRYAELQPLIGP
jgi:hypothetical protein